MNWKNWAWWILYIPVVPYYLYLAFRCGTLSFPVLTNPKIHLGGICGYSKSKMLEGFPAALKPKEILIHNKDEINIDAIESFFRSTFPLIIKPDRGERGFGIRVVNDSKGLENHLKTCLPFPIIIQEFIDLEHEAGFMYQKFPGDSFGTITSITGKEFIKILGNGTSTVYELIETLAVSSKKRAELKQYWKKRKHEIIKKGTTLTLELVGNHSRGTTFLDYNRYKSGLLDHLFDSLSGSLDEFYLGRYDVRFKSWDELKKGNMKIIEVNAVNSEPTHIYDPKTSLFQAYQILFRHWKIIFLIAKKNQQRGFSAGSFPKNIRKVYQHLKYKSGA